MPFDKNQFMALFAGAAKPYADYEKKFGGQDPLYALFQKVGQTRFQRLIQGLYPDQLNSVNSGLSTTELQALGDMSVATLTSLREVNASWIKNVLRIIGTVAPTISVQAAPSTVDQTTHDPTRANQLVTEVNAANAAPRNLIFDARGVCVAEINFGNHGGTATSGHAHIYPVSAMPITGHHVSAVPHFGNGDYPASWRNLPPGIAPARALWT